MSQRLERHGYANIGEALPKGSLLGKDWIIKGVINPDLVSCSAFKP
ncbi:MAG: hypothetical protein RH949_02050 [Coleofasciculus sp. A1-SPW-01]